jgi:hypothetical protein
VIPSLFLIQLQQTDASREPRLQEPSRLAAKHYYFVFICLKKKKPITVAQLFEACTIFARSEAAVVGYNPT